MAIILSEVYGETLKDDERKKEGRECRTKYWMVSTSGT